MKSVDNFKNWYRKLPEKKAYFELIGAVLSIPVLTTVILLNLNSLRNSNKTSTPTSSPETKVITVVPTERTDNIREATPATVKTQAPTPNPASCKQEVGPADIVSPQENETVNSDNVCIEIEHDTGEYCAVVWAYSINNSPYSDFNDKDICLYNLSPGPKNLKVRVKSIVSGDEKVLERNFIYKTANPPTSPTPSVGATVTP